MTPERTADSPANELTIARLPAGWEFRVAKTEDGAVLKGIKTQDSARALSQVRRQVQIGLTR